MIVYEPARVLGCARVFGNSFTVVFGSVRQQTCVCRVPECNRCATSVNLQLPCLQKDLRMGSISRDIVNFAPSSAGAEVQCSPTSHVCFRLSSLRLNACLRVRQAYHITDKKCLNVDSNSNNNTNNKHTNIPASINININSNTHDNNVHRSRTVSRPP